MTPTPPPRRLFPAIEKLATEWPVALMAAGPDGRLEWVNHAFEQLTGVSAELAAGQPATAWLPLPKEGSVWRVSRRPDGTQYHCRVHTVARADGGHWYTLVDLSGVTLQDGEPTMAQLQLAMELTDVIIWRQDPVSGRLIFGERGMSILGRPPSPPGWTRDEFITQVLHPEDWAAVEAAEAEARAHPLVAADLLVRYRHVDGAWHLSMTRLVVQHDPVAGVPALLGVALDVTERQRTQAELRQAHERIGLITQAVGMGTWMNDLVHHTVHWDAQMWALRGLAPAAERPSVQATLSSLHPDDREAVAQRNRNPLSPASDGLYEFRVTWPDGRVRWLASRSVLVRDEQGEPLQRIGVNWDVTDARSAASAQHERELAQRESAAKSELLARLSHELRTPLNAILSLTQLLIEDTQAPVQPAHQDRLHHIHAAGQHLLGLINDVLELTRPEGLAPRVEPQAVALAPLAERCLALVAPLAQQHQLRCSQTVPELTVSADPLRLQQILLNLLTNAIKYNRPGGEVALSARVEGDEVLIAVADTGIGMPPERIEEAFEPFHRLHGEQGRAGAQADGIGLGLAIVKTLVQRMGGRIAVRSQPGVGSEFELRLPLVMPPMRAAVGSAAADIAVADSSAGERSAAGMPAQAPDPAQPRHLVRPGFPGVPPLRWLGEAASRRARLLYVEDNPVNMTIVQELVRRHGGIDFIGAVDGAEGLALAREHQPDLILLDMRLPDAHGQQVQAGLQADARTADIACVALSANATEADMAAARRSGFADYWTKPLDFAHFGASLRALFGPGAGA